MHGLINRAVQCFVWDTYGQATWEAVATALTLGPEGFEAMLSYEDALTERLVAEVARVLHKPQDMVLEDVGTYLVSHPNTEAVRRLLRFGGESFADFLHSLDDLPDRARLAVDDLSLPEIEVIDGRAGQFLLTMRGGAEGFAWVMVGILRALADDYGALVLLDCRRGADGAATIDVSLLDSEFAEGRSFSLAGPAAARIGGAA